MIHLTIDLCILIIAIFAGFLAYKKEDVLYLKIFPYFLLLVLLIEFTGQLFQGPGQNNVILFNLLSVVEFSFFSYIFYINLLSAKGKKWALYTIMLVPTVCLVNIFLIQGPRVFHTYTYMAGALAMVILGFLYFYERFNSNEKVNVMQLPAFWVCIGITFFFFCSLSLIGSFNYVSDLPRFIRINVQKILKFVNAIFYLLFIIAFLCQINIQKSTSRS